MAFSNGFENKNKFNTEKNTEKILKNSRATGFFENAQPQRPE
jgi:hypothetical protein